MSVAATADKVPFFKKSNGLYANFLENKAKAQKDQLPKNSFNDLYSVGVGVLPAQTQNLISKKAATFNLLLAGKSGLGNEHTHIFIYSSDTNRTN